MCLSRDAARFCPGAQSRRNKDTRQHRGNDCFRQPTFVEFKLGHDPAGSHDALTFERRGRKGPARRGMVGRLSSGFRAAALGGSALTGSYPQRVGPSCKGIFAVIYAQNASTLYRRWATSVPPATINAARRPNPSSSNTSHPTAHTAKKAPASTSTLFVFSLKTPLQADP